MVAALENRLDQGLTALNLPLAAAQKQACLDYLQLLDKWNRAYNLSAVRDIEQMLSRHLFDSLSIVPYFSVDSCLDVGSGAGLPGIPLAIVYPDRQFTLVDSNGKKTRFLFQAVKALSLKNVTVEQCRVEEKAAPPLFAGVVSRAFSTINAILDSCAHLLAEGGQVLAMKGRYPESELAAIRPGFELRQIQPLTVPGLAGERHVIILHKT